MREREEELRSRIAVDVVIFSVRAEELVVLLVRRGAEPFAGCWALPGGYLRAEESLDEAARRELKESTGVVDIYLEQLYTFGELQRDPSERVLSVSYFALLDFERAARSTSEGQSQAVGPALSVERWALSGKDEAGLSTLNAQRSTLATAFWPVSDLPPLAFDYARILEYARLRLRWKIEYTNAVYSLLPERFTLSEVQRVYEIILRKPLDKRNFRKWILGTRLVEATGQVRREGAHRPAQLFRFGAREIRIL